MKLFSYHDAGSVRSGVMASGQGLDVAHLERAMLGQGLLQHSLPERFDVIDLVKDPVRLDQLRVGLDRLELLSGLMSPHAFLDPVAISFAIPTPGSAKILCVGRNYLEHVNESGRDVPGSPVIFTRYEDTLVAHRESMIRPLNSAELDWEGELAAIIGKPCRHVAEQDALDFVAGYSIFNEGSVRDYQHKTGQWTAGKNFPRSGAYGPYLVTADAVPDPQALDLRTTVNDEVVQKANTGQMIFPLARIISFISEWTELRPGDVIATGTPAGVGNARNPKRFLRPGDTVNVTIESVGELSNTIADEGGQA
jgi:2-keto-4-pentenoate hydratase/2-oxohepta-3-ene-1,7-dioic acid hydratase in catechol pathway